MLNTGGSGLTINLYKILEFDIRRNVIPIGLKNRVNLTYTLPGGEKFVLGTLEVWLSGLKMNPVLDFTENPSGLGFTLILEPNDPSRLNIPPFKDEPFTINYLLDC